MRVVGLAGVGALVLTGCMSLGSSEDDAPHDAGVGGAQVVDGSWASGGAESGAESGGSPGDSGPSGSGGSASGTCKLAADCDDQDPCTNDFCTSGACQFAPVDPDDGNACTVDSCDAQLGIQHAAKSCDDGDACTTDTCSPSSGCVNGPKTCDDQDECTNDACSPSTGCTFTPKAKTTTVCGTYCGVGFYIGGKYCLASVCSGACTYGYNRVTCKPVCGPKLTVCDTYCPPGYSATSKTCTSACLDPCGADGNATVCTKTG